MVAEQHRSRHHTAGSLHFGLLSHRPLGVANLLSAGSPQGQDAGKARRSFLPFQFLRGVLGHPNDPTWARPGMDERRCQERASALWRPCWCGPLQALGQKERERTHSLPTTFPAAQPTVPTTAPRQRATAAHSDAKDVPLQWTGSKEEEKEGLLRGAMAKEGVGDLACVLLCGQAVIRARGVIGLYLGFFLQVSHWVVYERESSTLPSLQGPYCACKKPHFILQVHRCA